MGLKLPIGVAILGGGIWAREEHAPAIEASEKLKLLAVYSRTKASCESVAKVVSGPIDLYSDDADRGLDDLLKRDDIKAVVVSLPIASQEPFIRKALLAGKHVLSEKPVAENVQAAVDLIHWYRTVIRKRSVVDGYVHVDGPMWVVAENFRFLGSYQHAALKIRELGAITGFHGRFQACVPLNWKYNLTEWRRTPTHQGGYLLDGGVHYIAGLRELLLASAVAGPKLTTVSAFTRQILPYLPPVDNADAILRTDTGVTGTLLLSAASPLSTNEWVVTCEGGWVKVENEEVSVSVVTVDGSVPTVAKVTLPNERTGVPPEIRAWADSLEFGTPNYNQEPECALADLEIIELILKSGQQNGTPLECKHQADKWSDATF